MGESYTLVECFALLANATPEQLAADIDWFARGERLWRLSEWPAWTLEEGLVKRAGSCACPRANLP